MYLARLRAENLRRFSALDLALVPGLNFAWGPNGSGKTTLLEAIHLLGTGKSFRPAQYSDLVSHGREHFGVSAELVGQEGADGDLGIRLFRSDKSTRLEIGGRQVSTTAVLARTLPLLTLDPHSFDIVEGGPRVRRSLLDRAAFHVEQTFLGDAKQFLEGLAQRNALLRSGGKDEEIGFWQARMAEAGQRVTDVRRNCIRALNERMESNPPLDGGLGPISLRFRQGWREGTDLLESLERNLPSDRNQGLTQSGPHKAEIVIEMAGQSVARAASRGQIKAVVTAMVVALSDHLKAQTGSAPIILVDDFAAELDERSAALTIKMLRSAGAQIFLTSVQEAAVRAAAIPGDGLFHVEQGTVSASSDFPTGSLNV